MGSWLMSTTLVTRGFARDAEPNGEPVSKRMIPVFAVALGLLLAGSPDAVAAEDSVIVVSATGTASARPDIIKFRIEVYSEALTAKAATEATAEKHDAIQATLRELGVPEEDSRTARFNVSQLWERDPRGQGQEPRGFSVEHTIQVQVQGDEMIGRIVDAVIGVGASKIGQFQFESSAQDSLRHLAIADAFKRARSEAEAIATAAGGRLGSLLEVGTQEAVRAEGGVFRGAGMAIMANASGTTVSAADKLVRVTLLQRWSLIVE